MAPTRRPLAPRSTGSAATGSAATSSAASTRAKSALARAADLTHASGRPKRTSANLTFTEDRNGLHIIKHGAPDRPASSGTVTTAGPKSLHAQGGPRPNLPRASSSTSARSQTNGGGRPSGSRTSSGSMQNTRHTKTVMNRELSDEDLDRILESSDNEDHGHRVYQPNRKGAYHDKELEDEEGEGVEEEEEEEEDGVGGRAGDGAGGGLEDDEEPEDFDNSRGGYFAENETSFNAPVQGAGQRKRPRRQDELILFEEEGREQLAFGRPASKRLRREAAERRRLADAEDEEDDQRAEAERRRRLAVPDSEEDGEDGEMLSNAAVPADVAQWRSHHQFDRHRRLLVSRESLNGEYTHFHAAKRFVIDYISSHNPWPTVDTELSIVRQAWKDSFDSERDGADVCPRPNDAIIAALRTRLGGHRTEVFRHVKNSITDWYNLNDPATKKTKASTLLENFNWSWRELTEDQGNLRRRGCFAHIAIIRAIEVSFFSPTAGAQGIGFSLPAFSSSIPKASIALACTAIYAALRNVAEGSSFKFMKKTYEDVYNRIYRHLDERINTGRIVYGAEFASRLREEAVKRIIDEEPLDIGEGFATDDVSDDQIGW